MAIERFYQQYIDNHGIIRRWIPEKTPTTTGEYTVVWTYAGVIDGVINQNSTREIEELQQLNLEADYKLFCAVKYEYDINNDDILEAEGEYYRVVGANKNTIKRDHHLRIYLKRTRLDKY